MSCLLGKKWSIRSFKTRKPLTNGSSRWSLSWYPCIAGQTPPGHSCITNLVYKKTSISNQNRRVSYSRGPRTSACFCAKARLIGVTSHQEDKETWESWGGVALKKENLKRWKVLGVSKLTYRLEKSLFQTAKGKSARRHQEKQRASAWSEIDRNSGRCRSKFNDNAKVVSKSLNKVIPWSHFNFTFSDG